MRLKNRKKSAAAIKSMKVGTDELKDLIKGAVKEAMGEEDDTGDDGSDAAAALDGITAEDNRLCFGLYDHDCPQRRHCYYAGWRKGRCGIQRECK